MLLLLLLFLSAEALVYVTPPTIEGTYLNSPEIELYFTDDWEGAITGVVLELNNPEIDNCTGYCIALTSIPDGELMAGLVASAKARGFSAIIIASLLETPEAGYNNYVMESVDDDDKIPAFEVTDMAMQDLLSRMAVSLVTVNLTKGDYNSWKESLESGGMIAWQVILSVSAFGCILLSLFRIFQFCQNGFSLNLATFGILTSLVANSVALGYFIADPLGCRRKIYFNGNMIWMTLPWSFTLVNTLSVCLFWSTVVKKSMKRHVSFLSMQESVVLLSSTLLFFGQDVTLSALRGYHIARLNLLWLITGVVYTVLMLLIVGWFFKKGVSILKTLRGQDVMRGEGSAVPRNTNQAEITTKLILMSSFGNIIFCCLLPILATDLFYRPPIFVAIFFFIYFSLQWTSWVQLMTYVPKRKK